MSIYARKRRMNDTATFWTLAGGGYYGGAWSTPATLACNYMAGGDLARDEEGNQFQPSSTFRFFGNPGIKVGDKIIQGTSAAAQPTTAAETVRKVITKTPMRGTAAYDILTG
jgi:hypothetical protein